MRETGHDAPPWRVASVPAGHPYVEHLGSLDVVRLPDPPVRGEDGSTRWWPPRMLDEEWLRAHADEFDILHVHFGFESFSPEHLAGAMRAVHAAGKGFVLTVHDLRNPHIADERVQLDRLDVLVPAADAVITLTQGAADVIAARWGRRAVVIPHPHIVPLDRLPEPDRPRRTPGAPQRVGLHLKSLRANVDALGALDALAELHSRRGAGVRNTAVENSVVDSTMADSIVVENVVTLHHDARDDAVEARLTQLSNAGAARVIRHDPMDNETLHTHVRSLDVSLMAYAWGTHSGWIEMCHDLGVRIVAPDLGFYREQHDPVLFDPSRSPASMTDALERALDLGPPQPPGRAQRERERDVIAAQHAQVYRAAARAAHARSTR